MVIAPLGNLCAASGAIPTADKAGSAEELLTPVVEDEQLAARLLVQLYPNPASERVMITGLVNGPLTYTVFGARGAVLAQGTTTDRSIPVHQLPAGLYAIALKDEQGLRHVHHLAVMR